MSCLSPHLNMDKVREDFPEPVLPTMPTRWPALMSRLTPFSTRGSPSLYLMLRSLRLIWPLQNTEIETQFPPEVVRPHLRGHWSGPGSPATVQSAS